MSLNLQPYSFMAIGRAERRAEREPLISSLFGPNAQAALDLFEIVEMAWHDSYGEVTPPPSVVEDMLTTSRCDLAGLVAAARLGLIDSRDLRVAAEEARKA